MMSAIYILEYVPEVQVPGKAVVRRFVCAKVLVFYCWEMGGYSPGGDEQRD